MRMKKRIFALVCIAAAAMCACPWIVHARQAISASQPSPQITLSAAPQSPVCTLFPELSSRPITALSLTTRDRSFQFYLDRQGAVSVNGQQADAEVFSTLLEQIETLPVEYHIAFAPQAQDLLLTLVISTDTHRETARFYEGSEEETARIVLESGAVPEYRQTNGWRVGTLMMTCEGTRILDAYGNETPVSTAR